VLKCCKEMVLPQIHLHVNVGGTCGKALERKGLTRIDSHSILGPLQLSTQLYSSWTV
jgi:hypothetical protein